MIVRNLLKSLEHFFSDRHASMTTMITEVCPASIEVIRPIPASVRTGDHECIARLDEAGMEISGSTESEAVCTLKSFIAATWSDLVGKDPHDFNEREREQFRVLRSYLASRPN